MAGRLVWLPLRVSGRWRESGRGGVSMICNLDSDSQFLALSWGIQGGGVLSAIL